MPTKRPGDVDAYRNALRPRMLLSSGGTAAPSLPTTIPPHTHHAREIVSDPEATTALLSADDVQEALEELGQEKLARSGEQTMLGGLDMNHFSIDNVDDIEVENDINMTGGAAAARLVDVRTVQFKADAAGEGDIQNVRDVSFVGAVGEGVIDDPRVIHMAGDHADDEAKVDGLERVVFNDEPTASTIERPSRIDWNTGVEAGVDYTPAEGRHSWDSLEDTLVVYVASGAGVVAIAFGWSVLQTINGVGPY